MQLNHSAIFTRIAELATCNLPVSACMCEVIDICSRDVPHADWSRFSELDYNGDVAALRSWIPRVFKNRPAPFSIQGLWIGLCNPCKGDMVWADMYVGAVSQYVPEDPELGWLWTGQRHYPKEAFADSSSLRAIYEIAYGTDFGLGNDAEWPLCLAFGALAARSLLRDQTTRLVDPTAPQIGVVVGFDSGDMLKLGELTSTGFVDPAFN